MSDTTLKPCPRCGGPAYFSPDERAWRVMCAKCSLQSFFTDSTKEKAAAWWNNRKAGRCDTCGGDISLCDVLAWAEKTVKTEGTDAPADYQALGVARAVIDKFDGFYGQVPKAPQAAQPAPEPAPTCNAKDEPTRADGGADRPLSGGKLLSDKLSLSCPYHSAHRVEYVRAADGIRTLIWEECGKRGWLCDRCQQDRADARTRALVRAILSMSPRYGDTDDYLRGEGLLS